MNAEALLKRFFQFSPFFKLYHLGRGADLTYPFPLKHYTKFQLHFSFFSPFGLQKFINAGRISFPPECSVGKRPRNFLPKLK